EPDIYAVESTPKSDRLYIHNCRKQLCRACFDTNCISIDKALFIHGKEYAQVPHTIAATALVINFFGMNTYRFPESCRSAERAGTHFFSHRKNLRLKLISKEKTF